MKRSAAAIDPVSSPALTSDRAFLLNAAESTTEPPSPATRWQLDGPAPVIRANMISFRLGVKGRIQVAFFDPRDE